MSLQDPERQAVIRFLTEARQALIADIDMSRAAELQGTVAAYCALVGDDLLRKANPEQIHDRTDLLVEAVAKLTN
jgi:hypothetical protein